MATSKKIAAPPRECAFCAATNLSEEHFYPQWMRDLLQQDGDFNGHHSLKGDFRIEDGEVSSGETVHRRHAGPTWATTFKVVCAACNGGWMSEIETAALPALTALIRGEKGVVLNLDQQRAIANWAFLKTVVDEWKAGARDRAGCGIRHAFRQPATGSLRTTETRRRADADQRAA